MTLAWLNEYLFDSEGFGSLFSILTLFTAPEVRTFRVGELAAAIRLAAKRKTDQSVQHNEEASNSHPPHPESS